MKIITYRCSVALPLEQTTQFTKREVSGTFYLVSNQLALTDEEQISFTLGLLKSFTQNDSVTFFVPDFLKRLLFNWNFEMWKDTELDLELSVAQHKSQTLKRAILECVHINEPLESIEFTEIADTLQEARTHPSRKETEPFTSTGQEMKAHSPRRETESFTLALMGQIRLFWSKIMVFSEPVYLSALIVTCMLIAVMPLSGKTIFPYNTFVVYLQQEQKQVEKYKEYGDSLNKRRLQIAIHEAPAITPPSAATQPSEEFYIYQVQQGDNPTSISKNCYGKYSSELWNKVLKDNPQLNPLGTLKPSEILVKHGQKLKIRNPANNECKP